jgi:hypothetical protein
MGYELLKAEDGYLLQRDWRNEREIIEASSLELIAEFLQH